MPLVFSAAIAACADDAGPAPNSVRMDFQRTGFFDAPVPDESLRRADSTIDVAAWPGAASTPLTQKLVDRVAQDARGFARTSTIYFRLSAPPGTLPTPAATLDPSSVVQLIDVDPLSPERGRRFPLRATFQTDGGPLGAPDLLGLTPYQGMPLGAGRLYAAVVLRELGDTDGRRLGQPAALGALRRERVPPGMTAAAYEAHRTALLALPEFGVATRELAGLAVFRTDDPMVALRAVYEDALGRPTVDSAFVAGEVFPEFCVYQATVQMPVYQAGVPPYTSEGGRFAFDANGPVLDRMEQARIVVTLPRAAMPSGGFPTVVFSRTGAGGDRPLVDRGPHASPGGPAVTPGTGLARDFALAGFAGVSIDGPLGGLRNPDGADEQFAIFNVGNPSALRDNVRQSAVELALAAHVVDGISIDVSSCPDLAAPLDRASLDSGTLALFGHSMGATIAPLALALEPRYGATVLSGAGGSYIENVLFKQQPLPVRPLAELFLEYSFIDRQLAYGDPAIMLFQWVAESADPPVYAEEIVGGRGALPRHVLMVQGIVDHYILPPIANATSLSFGLDLGTPALDSTVSELDAFDALADVIAYSGRGLVPLPASGNRLRAGASPATMVVVQHAADGIEDGHEVLFQRADARAQMRCFLAGFASGQPPTVPAVGGSCP